MDNSELRPGDSIRVAEIRKALIEEMRTADAEHAAAYAINDVKELKEDALTSLRHTIRHSQNESLKSRVSMWALDKIIESERADASDPMIEFLKGISPVEAADAPGN